MPKFEDLKGILDDHLSTMELSDAKKAEILAKTQDKKKNRSFGKYAAWSSVAVAACIAIVLLFTQLIPRIKQNIPIVDPGSTYSGSESFNENKKPSFKLEDKKDTGSKLEALLMEIKASSENPAGIKTDTSFIITTNNSMLTANTLSSRLTLNPYVEFTVTEKEKGEFILKTNEPLPENTVINVSYEDEMEGKYTWAFQTESSLTVRSTLPGKNTTGMPLNTGIEIYFSGKVENIEGYFDIKPSTSGTFLYENSGVIFVPSSELKYNTPYTVTIKKGLKDTKGMVLEEDYVFSFRTPEEDYDVDTPRITFVDNFMESFLPGDSVVLSVWADEYFNDRDLDVKIFSIGSAEEYLSIAQSHDENVLPYIGYSNDYEVDTFRLKLHSKLTAKIQPRFGENIGYWGVSDIILPDSLDEGWYLIDARIADAKGASKNTFIQKLVQISDLAVYASSLNGEGVVWVNDSSSGKPVVGAEVSLIAPGSLRTARTGNNGTVRISIPENEDTNNRYLKIDDTGKNVFIDTVSVAPKEEENFRDDYYTYVYTDREAYLPTDTISFWGKMVPRKSGTPVPDSLDVYLDGTETPNCTVKVSSNGCFEGKIEIANHRSTGSSIVFKYGEKALYYKYYYVMVYDKPSYILEADTDKLFYRRGEKVTCNIEGTFYSGEPAIGLDVSCYRSSLNYETKLDKNGQASCSFDPQDYNMSWRNFTRNVSVSTIGAEDVWVYDHVGYYYFETDYMLTAEILNEETAKVRVRTNKINFNNVNENTLSLYGEELENALRGEQYDFEFTVNVNRCEYIKIEDGTRYNHITKQNETLFTYDYQETPLYEANYKTVNGEFTTEDLTLDYSNNCYYKMTISYNTPDGANLYEELRLNSKNESMYYPYFYGNPYRFLLVDTENPSLGDDIYFDLNYNAELITSGSMLINISQDEILSTDILPAGRFYINMSEDLLIGGCVSGAYFDGRCMHVVDAVTFEYNTEERELNIDVTPEEDSYDPGDKVNAVITITDKNGYVVESDFALGVVDNASFAEVDQYPDPLHMMYNSFYHNYPTTYSSYKLRFNDGMYAEGGGDYAGENIRKNFLENAAFIIGKTDSNGKADVSFNVPDNLTSWRITCVAMTDDGLAGYYKTNILVNIPYFVNVVHSDEYLVGDDIVISVRAHGSENDSAYTVIVEGNRVYLNEVHTGSGTDYTYINLGPLDTGTYTLTVKGRSGKLGDAVQYEFRVVESRHEIPLVETFDLSKGLDISSLRYPVTLLVYDRTNAEYITAVARMLSYGSRFDQLASNNVACSILYGSKRDDLTQLQSYSGAIKLFAYGDDDVMTTAKALVAVPDMINVDLATDYLYTVLTKRESSSVDVALAYMGLAAQHEPVLYEVRSLLKSNDFTLTEQVYLATALALLGDMTNVNNWLDEHISDIESIKDVDEKFECVSQTLPLTAIVRSKYLPQLLSYVNENYSLKYIPNLDIAGFVRFTDLSIDSDASFICVVNGEKKTYDFDDTRFHAFTMSKYELEEADFSVNKGNIAVTAAFVGGIDNLVDNSKGKISIETTYDKPEGENAFYSLMVVEHEINVDQSLNDEPLTVSISIPTCARFVSCDWQYGGQWYFLGEEDGRLYLRLSGNSTTYTLRYYIRVIYPGTFVCEPVMITSERHGARFIGPADKFITYE